MSQFIARTALVLFAAFSLASCAMTSEIAPTAANKVLQPSVSQLEDGQRYSWEFTVTGNFDKIERDMTDSLLIITEQVKEIAGK